MYDLVISVRMPLSLAPTRFQYWPRAISSHAGRALEECACSNLEMRDPVGQTGEERRREVVPNDLTLSVISDADDLTALGPGWDRLVLAVTRMRQAT